tara:strand:+ start:53 stop:568 length:516 start_codon:yes stop_codon:yes gene_type:complete
MHGVSSIGSEGTSRSLSHTMASSMVGPDLVFMLGTAAAQAFGDRFSGHTRNDTLPLSLLPFALSGNLYASGITRFALCPENLITLCEIMPPIPPDSYNKKARKKLMQQYSVYLSKVLDINIQTHQISEHALMGMTTTYSESGHQFEIYAKYGTNEQYKRRSRMILAQQKAI